MTKKERARLAVNALKNEYPDAICSLRAEEPLQLLIATRLSAQCTDARVNLVTPVLFEKYPTLEAFCEANVEDVEEIIHSCGFYHGKARDIVGMSQKIRDTFGGVVPDTVEALTTRSRAQNGKPDRGRRLWETGRGSGHPFYSDVESAWIRRYEGSV